MVRNKILNPRLAYELANCGHTDLIMVTDSGFPIPEGANRIDLAFYEGIPDLVDVLKVLSKEIFVEEVHFAKEVKSSNPNLYKNLQEIYTSSGAVFNGTSHEELCNNYAKKARLIIRTGSFNPWGNIGLVVSTDPYGWFMDEDIKTLPSYIQRRKRIENNEVPDLD